MNVRAKHINRRFFANRSMVKIFNKTHRSVPKQLHYLIYPRLVISSSVAKLRSCLAQLDDSTVDLAKMSIYSELTIPEHMRPEVDVERAKSIENIQESNTLMPETDEYEPVCLSSMRKARDEDLKRRLEESNKLVQRLSDRKKELRALIFGNKLLVFIPFPTKPFAKLEYTSSKFPFKALDCAGNELKPIDINGDNN